jgi:hypothetical protein
MKEKETIYLGVTIYSGKDDDGSFYARDRNDSCYCEYPTEEEAIDRVKEHLDLWGLPDPEALE